jgi:hypothetical protein
VRHTVLEKLCPCWPPWRQASNLPRPVGDTAPSPGELVANDCFGRVAEHERLALDGLIAGKRCQAQAAAPEPPDQDRTKSVG